MKAKFKAWVRAHQYECFGLYRLGQRFTKYGVSYGADGYEREPSPPMAAGWYTVVVLDGTDDNSTYAYFTDPEGYTEYLCDCGISSMMSSCKLEDFPPEVKEMIQ